MRKEEKPMELKNNVGRLGNMLFSCINIHGFDAGENSLGGDIGSNDVGTDDNIPGICPISTLEFFIIPDTSICSVGPVS